jgi:pentatricopeptide repeat protein
MKEYNQYLIESSSETNQHLHKTGTLAPPLPTDYQLSLLLRAYRDHVSSSRSKPLGIAPVLRLLSQELHVPLIALKELCYTTFMTCAATPVEGRRIMKMMKDYNHPISSYSYSILVHIHSRKGDFRGAAEVLSEMNVEGVAPSLAAYTSFLAACYKVCNQGAISQAIKAEAGKLAWDKWKELRIIGLEPDVSGWIMMTIYLTLSYIDYNSFFFTHCW